MHHRGGVVKSKGGTPSALIVSLLAAALISACTINLPSGDTATVIVTPTTPPAVTVTADPPTSGDPQSGRSTPPEPTRTITIAPTPTVTVTRPPERSDYRNWLCTTSADRLPAIVPGESSNNVRLLQWSLAETGYYNAAIGGNYGAATREATSRFQLDNGLGGSGNVAVNTWSWLQYYLCYSDSGIEYLNP